MRKLENYVQGRWQVGEGREAVLASPSNAEAFAEVSAKGIDHAAGLAYARQRGGAALRAMSFAERGSLLKGLSQAIHGKREELITLAVDELGNTRSDAKFDLDGATGTLAWYASLGKRLGEARHRLDGEPEELGASSRLQGQHLFVPRRGVAVLINAYNFPAWGMAEKMATAILAGMPVYVKPGTASASLAHAVAKIIVESNVLPEGVFSFICGRAGDLLDHLEFQDCVAFTGSAATGRVIRSHPRILEKGVRVNVEADSVNSAILGPDVDEESETFDLFIRDVVNDLTQKAGQKCTAIRRVVVPEGAVEPVKTRIEEELARVPIGLPSEKGVRMGPLAGKDQLEEARARLEDLLVCTEILIGSPGDLDALRGDASRGAFMKPVVLLAKSADAAPAVHCVEVFGPVSTVIAYDGTPEAAADILARGEGSLVASFYSDDRGFAAALIEEAAPYQGRLVWGSKRVAGSAPTPGTVFPQFIHGGPGRAGDGEELGGVRGLDFYSQRVAVEGFGPLLERILGR